VAWIESHSTLARHPKTLRLARRLSVSVPTAIGHLHLLWWWALEYTRDGDLSGFDDEEVAVACVWEGEPAAFRAALTAAGFLDACGVIHDWDDYAGKLLDQRKANAEKQARWRNRHRLSSIESPNRDVTVTEPVRTAATVPNPTEPTLSPTEREAPDADAPDAAPEQMRLRLPKDKATDAVRAANSILGKKANQAERQAINEGVPATPQAQTLWESCLRTWRLRYEHNRSLEGPLEWFAAGGAPPKRPARTGGGAGGNGQYVQPQSQQRNPGPAPLKEPTPEEAAASAAEKERIRGQLAERGLAGRMARIGGPA
jgi:hypothetical protein